MVYGALAVQVGLSPLLTLLSSLIIVSGFAASTGWSPPVWARTGPGRNGWFRRCATSPCQSISRRLIGPQPWWRRLHLAWVLVDESYGLTVAAVEKGIPDPAAYKTASDVLLYSNWLLSSFLGALFGASLDPGRFGLDAVFPLVFAGLAAALIKGWRRWLAAGLAVLATIGAVLWLPVAWQVTTAGVVAAVVASALPERGER